MAKKTVYIGNGIEVPITQTQLEIKKETLQEENLRLKKELAEATAELLEAKNTINKLKANMPNPHRDYRHNYYDLDKLIEKLPNPERRRFKEKARQRNNCACPNPQCRDFQNVYSCRERDLRPSAYIIEGISGNHNPEYDKYIFVCTKCGNIWQQ